MPSRLIYLPIEPYQSRYTQYNSVKDGVYETCFREAGVNFLTIRPDNKLRTIKHGQVLDVVGRTEWGFSQINCLVQMICVGLIDPQEDVIFFEDFWTPGFEQLIYAQSSKFGPNPKNHAKVFSFCHAQTLDKYDFTHKWQWWMRGLEKVWWDYQHTIFCAAREMMPMAADAGMHITDGQRIKIVPVGHAFHRDVMLRIADWNKEVIHGNKYACNQVIYSSRLDSEKNPHFFLDLVDLVRKERKDITFIICSGQPEINSNDKYVLERLKKTEVLCQTNLTLHQYYSYLRASKVQFNCAFQDFISYTLLDATINGCAPLYPNWLTFPDALDHNEKHLYNNLDLQDAKKKLYALIDSEEDLDVNWVYKKYKDSVKKMTQIMGLKIDAEVI